MTRHEALITLALVALILAYIGEAPIRFYRQCDEARSIYLADAQLLAGCPKPRKQDTLFARAK